jgi:ribosomal 30S subunit maturation factor RimM
LVGLRVLRSDGSELGALVRVHEIPGSDVSEVRSGDGAREWMIPGRRAYIERIDLERGELRLRECDDLLEAVESPTRRPGASKERRKARPPRRAKSGRA